MDWSKTAPKRKFKRPSDTAGDFDDKVSPLSTLKRGVCSRRQCEACFIHLWKMSEGGRHDRDVSRSIMEYSCERLCEAFALSTCARCQKAEDMIDVSRSIMEHSVLYLLTCF